MSTIEAATAMPETRPMINGEFEGKNIMTIDQFGREDIELLLDLAGIMEACHTSRTVPQLLAGRLIKAVMFEDSSRTVDTHLSAAAYLGARVMVPDLSKSALNKGESETDTTRLFVNNSDGTLIRHKDPNFIDRIAERTGKPLTNGGGGSKDHPTQTFKDLYTFYKLNGSIDGTRLALVGDVGDSRVAKSLLRGLSLFNDIQVTIVAPAFAPMPAEEIQRARAHGVRVTETEDLRPLLGEPIDVYLQRPRREYKVGNETAAMERAYAEFGYNFSPESARHIHAGVRLFHARPSTTEIDAQFDNDPRANYIEQENNGLFTHMAALALQHAQRSLELEIKRGLLPSPVVKPYLHAV